MSDTDSGKVKKRKGRPPKPIDWEQVDTLCALQCTGREICAVLKIDEDTLTQRCLKEHGVLFSDYRKYPTALGHANLRRKLYDTAVNKNNVTMQIFLAKNWLGMKDRIETDVNVSGEIQHFGYTAEERDAIVSQPQALELAMQLGELLLEGGTNDSQEGDTQSGLDRGPLPPAPERGDDGRGAP